MSDVMADIIGICGSIIFIAAFAYANMAQTMNKLWFNIANLVGAVLLLTSLSVHFNLAAVILELAWAAIAAAGIFGALRARGSIEIPPMADHQAANVTNEDVNFLVVSSPTTHGDRVDEA